MLRGFSSDKADFRKAESEALTLLNEFGYSEPPINPVDIAKWLGVKVWFVTFNGDYESVSGFYDVDETAIYVNKDEYPHRQTFTVAHELGHHIMHKEWAKSSDYKMLFRETNIDATRTREKKKKPPQEQEADAFAANLLVPRFMLNEYKGLLGEKELSKLFVVSSQVIGFRLNPRVAG